MATELVSVCCGYPVDETERCTKCHEHNGVEDEIDTCAECGRNFRGHDETHTFITFREARRRQEQEA